MQRRDARMLPQTAQEELRLRAVGAVLAGRSQGEVARLFGVSRQTVNGWVKAHRQGGERALASRKRGRRPGGQQAQIARAIRDKNPTS